MNPQNPSSSTQPAVRVVRVDYSNPLHAKALSTLLDAYARDVMGGGKGLTTYTLENLASELQKRPQAFSVLAFLGHDAVGLVNCIEGFSTFACKPLVNVHDVAVRADCRGRGIANLMLQEVEGIARERGACKLTLEVLQGNTTAIRLYERVGFAGYQLDPAMGQAMFFQKVLIL
jgi:ribosomal protein S18 acetylase RimI-like enzyme